MDDPKNDDTMLKIADVDGIALDMAAFNQILDMDDLGSHEFSQGIVYAFFDQAKDTFGELDTALKSKDLQELGRKGHFLKGSSATVGLIKVREGCETIERYGRRETPDGTTGVDEKTCLEHIAEALTAVKEDLADVEKVLRNFYETESAKQNAAETKAAISG